MPKALCIIQARMGSTRLPGKVMKSINGKPVLWHVYHRVKRAKKIDQIVMATTNLPADDVIANFCKEKNIDCFRGDEQDVLSRYYQAAKKFNGEIIIRITSDCPLIEPRIIDLMLEKYSLDWAYYSNCHPIRVVPIGLDVEISNFKFLKQAYDESTDPNEREHVFPYIYKHPEKFLIKTLEDQGLDPNVRITLDTQEDFELIESIYKELKNRDFFSIEQILPVYNSIQSKLGMKL